MKIEDVINRKELAERLDGDMELYRELALLFIEDSQKLMNNIFEAIKESDADKLRKYAHTIKGSVSNFSAQAAYDAAFELENMGRNNHLETAEAAFQVLKEKIEQAKEAMRLLMQEQQL